MSPPRELELKFEVPASSLPTLSRGSLLRGTHSSGRKSTNLVSVYFDTKKLKLRRKALSLRIRRVGRRIVQTVKQETRAATFIRNEWEHDIGARHPDLKVVQDTPLGPLLSKEQRRGLMPVFETRVRRKVIQLQCGGSKIELCIHKREIEAAGEKKPIYEAEPQIKRGDRMAVH